MHLVYKTPEKRSDDENTIFEELKALCNMHTDFKELVKLNRVRTFKK